MTIERTVTIAATAERTATQILLRISTNINSSVEVVLNTGGVVSTRNFSGTQYDDLMSANPSWSVNKPAGVFRPEDIFAYIDYLGA